MSSEKTELPTPQKLRKAREEGQVAHSKDFTQTVLLLALFGYLLINASSIAREFAAMIALPVGAMGLSFEAAVNTVATDLLWSAVKVLAPFLGIVIGVGMFVELAQTGMLLSFKAMTPSGKKLNVANNVKNIFGMKNLVEFLKSTIKITLLSVIIYYLILHSLPSIMTLPSGGLIGVGTAVATLMESLMTGVALGYAIIAAADFLWQRHQYVKGLMMTRDEVEKEYKEAEGDPHIKHKRKELHREMLHEGAVANTRNATAVVTNPTHLAVALLYDAETTPLPVVLAKGEGALAYRMVEAAREEGIPVLQDIPLARALMATAHVEQYIPSDLIEPVAEVLRLVRDMKDDVEE